MRNRLNFFNPSVQDGRQYNEYIAAESEAGNPFRMVIGDSHPTLHRLDSAPFLGSSLTAEHFAPATTRFSPSARCLDEGSTSFQGHSQPQWRTLADFGRNKMQPLLETWNVSSGITSTVRPVNEPKTRALRSVKSHSEYIDQSRRDRHVSPSPMMPSTTFQQVSREHKSALPTESTTNCGRFTKGRSISRGQSSPEVCRVSTAAPLPDTGWRWITPSASADYPQYENSIGLDEMLDPEFGTDQGPLILSVPWRDKWNPDSLEVLNCGMSAPISQDGRAANCEQPLLREGGIEAFYSQAGLPQDMNGGFTPEHGSDDTFISQFDTHSRGQYLYNMKSSPVVQRDSPQSVIATRDSTLATSDLQLFDFGFDTTPELTVLSPELPLRTSSQQFAALAWSPTDVGNQVYRPLVATSTVATLSQDAEHGGFDVVVADAREREVNAYVMEMQLRRTQSIPRSAVDRQKLQDAIPLHTPQSPLPLNPEPRFSRGKATSRSRSRSRACPISRQQRARSAHTVSRTVTAASERDGFVNYTPQDSSKLLSGVAPSGSSKTKARREKEAADRRRMLNEAAVKAVVDAGGDPTVLSRAGIWM